MLSIHPNLQSRSGHRAGVARSAEPTGVLAMRWRVVHRDDPYMAQAYPADRPDRSARPSKLPGERLRTSDRSRQAFGFPLDDHTFVISRFLPHLNLHSMQPQRLDPRPGFGVQGRAAWERIGWERMIVVTTGFVISVLRRDVTNRVDVSGASSDFGRTNP